MADTKETFKLDLDAKDFLATAKEAKKAINEIGDVESVANLVSFLETAGAALAGVAIAAYGFKTALDLTQEAESIKRINSQFEMLSQNVGVSTEALKSGLERSADGLIDTTDLLKSANKALVEMGSSAAKLPELLTVARNVTRVFGGELTANFEALNTAIATGQTRALRHLGLIVDSEAAYRKYANQLGVTVSALTDAEKRQAILNEVLAKSAKTFKNTTDTADSTSVSIQRLKVALNELKEAFALSIEKGVGPGLRAMLTDLAQLARAAVRNVLSVSGEGAEQIKASIEKGEAKISQLRKRLESMERPRVGWFEKIFAPTEEARARVAAMIATEEARVAELRDKLGEVKKTEAPAGKSRQSEVDEAENAKRLEAASKFEASLQELRLQRIKSEEQTATSVEDAAFLSGEKIVALRELRDAKMRELDAQRALQEIATDEELNLKKEELAAKTQAEITKIQWEADKQRIESLNRFAEANKNTWAGFAGGVRAASAQASSNFSNLAKLGHATSDSFKKNFTSAFLAIGSGSKSAGDAMKGAFLGVIADMAEAQGAELMLAGLWPPNPLALGAGAALVALAGFLRSQAGGAGGMGAAGGGAGGGGAGGAGMAAPEMGATAQQAPQLPETKQRAVTVNIMGHYLETPETRRMLTEILRQESDATQFTIAQVGQGA